MQKFQENCFTSHEETLLISQFIMHFDEQRELIPRECSTAKYNYIEELSHYFIFKNEIPEFL